MSIAYGGSSITFEDGSVNSSGFIGHRNRIINGAMVIDQRNAGASVTPTSDGQYGSCDRWNYWLSQASKFSAQQSSTAPTGFSNSLLITSLSAYSVTGNDYFSVNQKIEGFNFADMMWGTANAQTVTLSFWVRSSLTGTFGGTMTNSAFNRSYPFSYTINAENTWEQKTVIIAGDQSGTWIGATNGVGVIAQFNLGSVASKLGTANIWAGSWYTGATGATSVVGTSGATFYITGVQLERGSTASSFEYRPYGTELALCQRYLPAFTAQSGTVGPLPGNGTALGTGSVLIFNHPVPARVPGTGLGVSAVTHFNFSNNDGNSPSTAVSFAAGSPSATQLSITVASSRGGTTTPGWFYANNTAARLYITGCEL